MQTQKNSHGPAAPDTASPFGTLRASLADKWQWYGATARWLPRTWRKRIRKRFARYRTGPFDTVVGNIRFRLYPAENHTDRVIFGRGELPEIPERALLAPHMAANMTFVDIGANIGLYSLFVAQRTEGTARIIAFEPHPRTFAKLEYNCAANGFGGISCVNCGVGPGNEQAELYSDGGGNIGGASMLREAAGGKVSTGIVIRPLADVLKEKGFDRIDALKIDIEGYEDRALLPFFDDPANRPSFPRIILLETVHLRLWQRDLIGRLLTLGYVASGQTDENILLEHCA